MNRGKKKILVLVGRELAPNEERLIFNLNNLLIDDFEFVVFGASKHYHSLNAIVQLTHGAREGCSLLAYFAYVKNFYKAVVRGKPDLLLQLNSPMISGPIVAVIGMLNSIPYVLRLPGDKLNIYKTLSGFKQARAFLENNIIGLFFLKQARNLIFVGEYLSSTMPPSRVSVNHKTIYQPLDFQSFKRTKDKKGYREELHLPVDKKIILYVGRLSYEKGADILEKIILDVNSRSEQHFFVLVGEGEFENRLSRLENVMCTGSVLFQGVHKYFLACDEFVFPSRREGVPNVILEALLCNMPIACSSAGEMPYLVDGICNTVDDYVNYILSEKVAATKNVVPPEFFDRNQMRKQYTDVFMNAIENLE